ncbi:unnamed protein product [Rotaria sp. Silwood1]|nr:unnamed protein product [Rotaria sp. Silwood1]CAF0918954.1 unnamed protein product [Rotaria sp. Silwood1]CAF0945167.1 unnamed protein product [Rotaria sp. Silwood1]CAF3375619.1 unnamed protein product [Rotaria sp. Silwood1]CAF3395451.1 unnamed protein product [Rotaria sp. Silwood1]
MYDSKHRTTDTQIYESRNDGSGYPSNKREWNLQTHGFNEETSNHRKYIRTQLSSNNRVASSSSSSQQQPRENDEKKILKDTKKPLRVSGDWSEFKSSTGKTYFYNCKTEISQWEKPKGWLTDESNRTSTSSSISTTNRIKKESTPNVSSTVRTRYKIEELSSEKKLPQILNSKLPSEYSNNHHNGNHTFQESLQSNEQLPTNPNHRLPTPDDDNSQMSFSSSSSKESSLLISGSNNTNESNGTVLHSSLSESAISVSTSLCDIQSKPLENNTKFVNGNDNKYSVSQSTLPSLTNTESTLATGNESPIPTISKAEREQNIQKFYRAELIQHLTGWSSTQLEKQCFKLFDDYYGYSAKMSTAFTELKALKSNFRILEIKRNILRQRLLSCQKHIRQGEEDKHL